jgi:hypothetical protein
MHTQVTAGLVQVEVLAAGVPLTVWQHAGLWWVAAIPGVPLALRAVSRRPHGHLYVLAAADGWNLADLKEPAGLGNSGTWLPARGSVQFRVPAGCQQVGVAVFRTTDWAFPHPSAPYADRPRGGLVAVRDALRPEPSPAETVEVLVRPAAELEARGIPVGVRPTYAVAAQ